MNEVHVPTSLVSRVCADLKPVTPLPAPSRRMLALMPLVLILLFGPALCWGWRTNLALLPTWTSFGLSAIQSLAGVGLMALALRQAVPGLAIPVRWLWLAFAGAALLFAMVSLIAAQVLPTRLEQGSESRLAWECVFMELQFALPSIAIPAWLVARALPTRPALTGAAYGLSVALMTDAGMRLFCWIDQSSHLFAAHGGAIVLGMTGGALIATLVERSKYRRLRT